MAFKLLGRSSLSRLELLNRLVSRGISEEVASNTVKEFESLGYIDDTALAIRLIEKHGRLKPVGRGRLLNEMLRRGIDKELAAAAVNRLISGDDELLLAVRAVHKAGNRFDSCGLPQRCRRIAGFLYRRGFSPETISKVMRKLSESNPNPLDLTEM